MVEVAAAPADADVDETALVVKDEDDEDDEDVPEERVGAAVDDDDEFVSEESDAADEEAEEDDEASPVVVVVSRAVVVSDSVVTASVSLGTTGLADIKDRATEMSLLTCDCTSAGRVVYQSAVVTAAASAVTDSNGSCSNREARLVGMARLKAS